MSVTQKNPAHDIPEWLEIAAKDLSAPVKERILLEIEAHYTEAIADHLAQGLSEPDAAREVMAELGDAAEAAKRFRKQHLTSRESEIVEQAFKKAKSGWHLLGGYLFWLLWLCLYVPLFGEPYRSNLVYFSSGKPNYSNLFFLAGALIVNIIFPTVSFFMVRHKSRNLGILFLTEFPIYALWTCGISLSMFGFGFLGFLISVLCLGLTCLLCIFIPQLRIWFKVRRVTNVWDEISLRNE
jgi:hypothetical protein